MKKLMVLVMVAACAATVLAQTREWVGAANGVWSEPSNWDPAGTPAANDVLKFGDKGGYPSENDTTLAYSLCFTNTTGHPVTITGKKIFLNGTGLVDGNHNNAVLSARYAKDTVTIEPDVQRTGGSVNIMGTGSADYPLVFKGSVSGWFEGGGTIFFDKAVDFTGAYGADWWTTPIPNLYFNATGNVIPKSFLICCDGALHFGCEDAFTSAQVNTIQISINGSRSATLDLGGFNQSVKMISSGADAGNTYAVTSPADKPAVLRLDTSSNMRNLAVVFTGSAGFELNAQDKTLEASFTRASSTIGSLTATKGIITLNAAWSQAKTVSVGAEGQLNLAVAGALSAQAAVTVADGGVLNIAENCDCTVLKLVLPDAGEVDPGEWGSAESGAPNTSTALAGKGRILVTGEKSAATWAGDDTADGIAVASNWKVGGAVAESINVTGGGLLATFAESGTHATVDRATSFDGLVFTAPSFAFAKTGSGVVGVGEKGITAAAAEGRTMTFEPAVRAMANQTWNLAAGNTLVLNGGLTGGTTITKTGAGDVVLNAAGEGSGLLSFTEGRLKINVTEFSRPLSLLGEPVYNAQGAVDHYADVLVPQKGVKTVFTGSVTYTKNTEFAPSGATVIEFAGGFSGCGTFRPKDTSRYVFSGKPATFTGTSYFDSGNANGVEFAVAGNTTAGSAQFYLYNGVGNGKILKCSVPWAFNYDFYLMFGCPWSGASVNSATLDISGGDQGLSTLNMRKPDPGFMLDVTSTGDSVLHVKSVLNNTSGTHNLFATFKGGAGFALTNTSDQVVTVDSVSTSTGRVCVAAGTLTFREGATWVNASKLEVSGGKLCVPRKGIFTNKELAVELTGGVLELGAVQRAKSVRIGETVYTQGTVGAVGSGADVETALIEGSGVLKLKTGLVLTVR